MNTMKSPIKEPKVSKIPVPRPDSSLLSRTSKNVTVGANDLKRNQIAHPGNIFIDIVTTIHYQKYFAVVRYLKKICIFDYF